MVIVGTNTAIMAWGGGRRCRRREVVGMPNEKNLKPLNKRTKSEQREIQSVGGKASGAARRRKRSLREAADMYLSLPVSDKKEKSRLARKGVELEDIDNQMAIIIGLAEQAALGDAKAAKVIIDLIGDERGGEAEGAKVIIDV